MVSVSALRTDSFISSSARLARRKGVGDGIARQASIGTADQKKSAERIRANQTSKSAQFGGQSGKKRGFPASCHGTLCLVTWLKCLSLKRPF